MLLTLLIKQEENSADSLSVAKPRGSDPPISADRTSICNAAKCPPRRAGLVARRPCAFRLVQAAQNESKRRKELAGKS